jgi:hypothetical protein
MYRLNPIYKQPELYYEMIRILEKICDFDLKRSSREEILNKLQTPWVRDHPILGNITPLKLMAKNLFAGRGGEDRLLGMLLHPDLPLVIEELEKFTGINWLEQEHPIPPMWDTSYDVPKFAPGPEPGVEYRPRSLLKTIVGRYSPETTEEQWKEHIRELHAFKGLSYAIPDHPPFDIQSRETMPRQQLPIQASQVSSATPSLFERCFTKVPAAVRADVLRWIRTERSWAMPDGSPIPSTWEPGNELPPNAGATYKETREFLERAGLFRDACSNDNKIAASKALLTRLARKYLTRTGGGSRPDNRSRGWLYRLRDDVDRGPVRGTGTARYDWKY